MRLLTQSPSLVPHSRSGWRCALGQKRWLRALHDPKDRNISETSALGVLLGVGPLHQLDCIGRRHRVDKGTSRSLGTSNNTHVIVRGKVSLDSELSFRVIFSGEDEDVGVGTRSVVSDGWARSLRGRCGRVAHNL